MEDEPPSKIVHLLVIVGLICLVFFFSKISEGKKDIPIEISFSDLFIEAPRMPSMPEVALYGVNISWELYKIVEAESNFDPSAVNWKYGERGGIGLAQLIPKTVKYCEEKLGKEINPYDPTQNLECADYLFKTDGNRHWGCEKCDWGSWKVWSKEI